METKPNSSNPTKQNRRNQDRCANRVPVQCALRTQSDKFPDPTVLSAAERLAEFGKLLLRGVERRAAKQK